MCRYMESDVSYQQHAIQLSKRTKNMGPNDATTSQRGMLVVNWPLTET